MWDGHFSLIKPRQQPVELPSSDSLWKHPSTYQGRPRARDFEKQEIDQSIAMYATEAAQTEWVEPIVFIHRKDGVLWFFVNYQKLLAVTFQYGIRTKSRERGTYWLVWEHCDFSRLGAIYRYWQVVFAKGHCYKMVFRYSQGRYQFLYIPSALKNAPCTFLAKVSRKWSLPSKYPSTNKFLPYSR